MREKVGSWSDWRWFHLQVICFWTSCLRYWSGLCSSPFGSSDFSLNRCSLCMKPRLVPEPDWNWVAKQSKSKRKSLKDIQNVCRTSGCLEGRKRRWGLDQEVLVLDSEFFEPLVLDQESLLSLLLLNYFCPERLTGSGFCVSEKRQYQGPNCHSVNLLVIGSELGRTWWPNPNPSLSDFFKI